MAEKMYSFTHVISESKLLAMISQHSEEVRIDIIAAPQKGQRRLQNGTAPLMLEGPQHGPTRGKADAKVMPMRPGADGKKSVPHLTLEYLALHKDRVVRMSELEAQAVKHHKPKHAVSVAISAFLKKGFVERVGTGQYKILQEGAARVGPSTSKTAKKKSGPGRGNYDRSNKGSHGKGTALIWAELAKGDSVARPAMAQIYNDNGLSPTSVSGAFDSFVRRGLAKRVEAGVFQITKKGAELHAKQTETKQPAPELYGT